MNGLMKRKGNGLCEHRSVIGDGRIVCAKITLGDSEVSPNLCRDCPAKAVACQHLRFSLEKSSPSAIVVRYAGGRTEVWNDEPPSISFCHAACEVKVAPVSSPKECVACSLRLTTLPQPQIKEEVPQRKLQGGKVIPFPQPVAATG